MRNRDRAVAASQELRGYFGEIIADRRRNTRDDLVSQLISAEVERRRLAMRRSIRSCCCSCPLGRRRQYRSSSNLLFGLLRIRTCSRRYALTGSLVPQAIEEALRWETPLLTVARTATQEVALGGVHVPAGGFVAVSLGAANRDPGRYPEPDAFDVSGGTGSTCRSAMGRISVWGCIWRGSRCGCW